jgi:hypothetical protein
METAAVCSRREREAQEGKLILAEREPIDVSARLKKGN